MHTSLSVREEKDLDRKGETDIFGADPLPGLVYDALAQQIQGVCACRGKKITERSPWKLADRNVVW